MYLLARQLLGSRAAALAVCLVAALAPRRLTVRTDWLEKTLIRFHAGGGVKKDIDNMYYLSENMLGKTFCPLGDAAAMPTMAFVKKFKKEFEDHLDGKPCPFETTGATEPVLA